MSVDWNNYSEVYDIMAGHNPAYQEIVAAFDRFLESLAPDHGFHLVDLGAGTGNFSIRAAAFHPGLRVTHVDSNPGMNKRAREKADGVPLEILETSLEHVDFPPASVHAAVCVHSLYTLADPLVFLIRLHRWMAPGGKVFLCDLGRVLDLADWRRYFLRTLMLRMGPLRTARIFWAGRGVVRENKNIVHQQLAGRYWLHSPGEFSRSIESAGFQVLHSSLAYRGYSDLVIAGKPLDSF